MSYILLKDCIGKDRGWKVNMITVELWSKELMDEAFTATSLYSAVYAGLMANCKIKKEEPDFTFEQVTEWVDEVYHSAEGKAMMNEVKEKFEESQYYIDMVKKFQDIVDEIEPKKKERKKA